MHGSLIPLWIYITLKQHLSNCSRRYCLIPLWIYITLKQNLIWNSSLFVLYLYEFTLLSNDTVLFCSCVRSYTSMNLHYSQTGDEYGSEGSRSYTSMNLHYSQTQNNWSIINLVSYTSMNLHYSQTLIPNSLHINLSYTSMNLHYSQTRSSSVFWASLVLYLYEFTLLSNLTPVFVLLNGSYTSMNLHYSQTMCCPTLL